MARPQRPQIPPPPESKRFDPDEAAQAKDRLFRRITDLRTLHPNAPDYVSKANIALDTAKVTVRDLFGAQSDESDTFRTALLRARLQPNYRPGEDVDAEDRRAASERVQEAIARLENLIEIVDEKTAKGGVGVAPTTTTAPLTSKQGGTVPVKVFISWSGDLSHRVALALRGWLPVVLPFVEPWVSSEDIQKGRRWGAELASQLEGTHSGIVCLVPGNIDEPWLNFEVGALSKSVREARVHAFLLSPAPVELDGPLGQFQATRFTKDDVKKLVKAINSDAGLGTLPAEVIDRNFEVCWPVLERQLTPLLAEVEVPTAGADRRSPPTTEPAASPLTAEDIKMLVAIANARDGLRQDEAAAIFRVHPQRAQHVIDGLERRGLIEPALNYLYGTAWHLADKGRAFLVKQGLL